jgi:hypothetical protein
MNPYYSKIQRAFSHPKLADLVYPDQSKIINNEAHLPAWFKLSELATASIASACSAITRLQAIRTLTANQYVIDQRLCNFWFGFSINPIYFELPDAWDDIAGDYPTKDGWIRLHTNAPHHKSAALSVLKCENNREAVSRAIAQWQGDALETAVVNAEGCAAKMNSIEQWRAHPQGSSLQNAPLIEWQFTSAQTASETLGVQSEQPLAGIKVLDLTRVLAGPVATRFLAGFGAQVLRLDPVHWNEPSLIPEVCLGKNCAELDLKSTAGKQRFIELLKNADVLVHGYRADALERLGFGSEQLKEINPNLICASLNAYGWQGPWENRRGFDSLLQMSSGIAHYAMQQSASERPTPLPVQGLDHATGYLLAATVIQGIELREQHRIITQARCSLGATAQLLLSQPLQTKRANNSNDLLDKNDYAPNIEQTTWGSAQRLHFPATFSAINMKWPKGAQALRTSKAQWE